MAVRSVALAIGVMVISTRSSKFSVKENWPSLSYIWKVKATANANAAHFVVQIQFRQVGGGVYGLPMPCTKR